MKNQTILWILGALGLTGLFFLLKKQKVIDNMDSLEGWVPCNNQISLNTTTKQKGSGAINIYQNIEDVGNDLVMGKTFLPPRDYTGKSINFYLYIANQDVINAWALGQFYLTDSAGRTNRYGLPPYYNLQVGWNLISYNADEPDSSIDDIPADLTDVTRIRIAIEGQHAYARQVLEGEIVIDNIYYAPAISPKPPPLPTKPPSIINCDTLDGWNPYSYGRMFLETSNIKEGKAAVLLSGTTNQYGGLAGYRGVIDVSEFELPDNTLSGTLSFWVYINDVSHSKLTGKLEFGNENNAYQVSWSDPEPYVVSPIVGQFSNGWNYVELPFSEGTYMNLGEIDWSAVNWTEFYTNVVFDDETNYFIFDDFRVT